MINRFKIIFPALVFAFSISEGLAEPNFEPNLPAYSIGVCSEYVWVDTEYQIVCLRAYLTQAGDYVVTAVRECKMGEGTCPDSPFGRTRSYCYADNESSSGVIETGNGQKFAIELVPEDCKYISGEPEGAQLIATTNGKHVLTTDYERLLSRYRAEGQICWSSLGGGSRVERSADVVAEIDGWPIETDDYIDTLRSEREVNYCRPEE